MKSLCFPLIALLASAAASQAATIAYNNDFSGTGDNTAFPTETTDARWALDPSGVYRNTYTTTGQVVSSASIPITNAANTNFVLETRFTVTSVASAMASGGTNTMGFGAFGLDNVFTGGATGNAYYLADFAFQRGSASSTADGRLRILSLGDGAGFTGVDGVADANGGSTTLAISLNTAYILRLTGTYAGSTLSLALGLFDENGVQIGSSATATDTSALTGTNFGYRNRSELSTGSDPITIDYDNFSIVPEPSSLLLLAGSLGSLVILRRRN